MEKIKPGKEKQSYRRQYIIAFCQTLITATAGSVIGWTSPTLPQLLAEISPIPITPAESSWIASIMILSSTASVLPAAYLAERFGRKRILLLAAVPYIAGWILIICAYSILELYISRVLSGIGYGIIYAVSPMYLGEIASDKIRGALACMITFMNKLGILFEYCIGPYVTIKGLASISLLVPVLFVITFIWQPESPHFYVKRGETERAEKSLQVLLHKEDVSEELEKVENLIFEQTKNKGKWIDLVKESGNRRAMLILLVIYTTQQLCGSAAIVVYAQQIFVEASDSISASESSIVLGSVQLIVSLFSLLLVDRLGRRPLLLMSAFILIVTNGGIGTYFYVKHLDPSNVENIGWLPIMIILIYIIGYNIGLAAVPFAVTSEIFPSNIKPLATSIIQMYIGLTMFAVTKLYQVIADTYGTHVIFWIFGIFSLIGYIVLLLYLPETKGQSLSKIQDKLNRNSRKIFVITGKIIDVSP